MTEEIKLMKKKINKLINDSRKGIDKDKISEIAYRVGLSEAKKIIEELSKKENVASNRIKS